MAEPFSIATGVVGLADVCFKLIKYAREMKKGSATIQGELDGLISEVIRVQTVCDVVKGMHPRQIPANAYQAPPYESPIASKNQHDLWEMLKKTNDDCSKVVVKLHQIVMDICEPGRSPDIFGVIVKVHRKRSKKEDLQHWRGELVVHQQSLHFMVQIIQKQETEQYQQNTEGFKAYVAEQLGRIQTQIVGLDREPSTTTEVHNEQVAGGGGLKQLSQFVTSVADIAKASNNEFFSIPQNVSNLFRGRETELQRLAHGFFQVPDPLQVRVQRCFVVHGMGGSGKTQFCCKFAQENRERYWGIFWIDASSSERIKITLGDIAKFAGREGHNAALHWLANTRAPWLLIIDNADDPRLELDDYFPRGQEGHILITTRSHELIKFGNIEPSYYTFEGLRWKDASDLLLTVTNERKPWTSESEQIATTITRALGYLALAIVHAGAAVQSRACSLGDYLNYYYRILANLRNNKGTAEVEGNKNVRTVWATVEICFQKLESRRDKGHVTAFDAIELLQTFAFLHRDNISLDTLTRALRSGLLEAEQEATDAKKEKESAAYQKRTLFDKARVNFLLLSLYVRGKQVPPPLPAVIREGRKPGAEEDARDRINAAIRELMRLSLLHENENNKTYYMHPIVHDWVSKGPRMRFADQALWAEIAASVLSASILLPPLGISDADEKYQLGLLTHIKHVQSKREESKQHLDKRRTALSWLAWATGTAPLADVGRLRMYARFSMIYFRCGKFDEAEALIREVAATLTMLFGPEDKKARTASGFLASVLREMGKVDEALQLQQTIVATCQRHFGQHDSDTLRARHQVSVTLWQQGLYTQARKVLKEVVPAMRSSLGSEHEDTLAAIDDLGRTEMKFWYRKDMESALRNCREAVSGMDSKLGGEHLRTLQAKENVARIGALMGEPHLDEALQYMEDVHEVRKNRMGREAPWTLLAMANKAIVLAALGRFGEAEEIVLDGLDKAKRNLGKDHIGVLSGLTVLGCIYVQRGRYKDAASTLERAEQGQKKMSCRRQNYHPDRIGSLIELARCYYLQGKLERSIEVCDEIVTGLDAISEEKHPLAEGCEKAREDMRGILARRKEPNIGKDETANGDHILPVKFPPILFKLPQEGEGSKVDDWDGEEDVLHGAEIRRSSTL